MKIENVDHSSFPRVVSAREKMLNITPNFLNTGESIQLLYSIVSHTHGGCVRFIRPSRSRLPIACSTIYYKHGIIYMAFVLSRTQACPCGLSIFSVRPNRLGEIHIQFYRNLPPIIGAERCRYWQFSIKTVKPCDIGYAADKWQRIQLMPFSLQLSLGCLRLIIVSNSSATPFFHRTHHFRFSLVRITFAQCNQRKQ